MELKTLEDIRVIDSILHHEDREYFIKLLRKEALNWLEAAKDEINIADWVEFFGLEKEFADLCFGAVNG
jgi:hypothetical protein